VTEAWETDLPKVLFAVWSSSSRPDQVWQPTRGGRHKMNQTDHPRNTDLAARRE